MGRLPTSGIPGASTGPGVLEHEHAVRRDVQVRVVDAGGEVGPGTNRRRRLAPRCLRRWGCPATCLITAPSGQRLPVQDGEAAAAERSGPPVERTITCCAGFDFRRRDDFVPASCR